MTVNSLLLPHVATVLLALFVHVSLCLPLEDEVLSFPGWSDPLPSRQFSGYVNNTDGGSLHYLWVFPEDVPSATAPVIVWTNGGPGCSSMEGYGYELGPFQFLYWNSTAAEGIDGYSVAPFVRNPYTWARLAHVVFLENPPGVGFSYRTDGNFSTSDTQNAASNYAALQQLLLVKFAEFVGNGFYLSGESYAGIYVPMLADAVLRGGGTLSDNFLGIIVGNGVTDNAYDSNFATSTGLYAVQHGLMLWTSFLAVVQACLLTPSSDECAALWWAFDQTNLHMNPYSYSSWCFNPAVMPPLQLAREDSQAPPPQWQPRRRRVRSTRRSSDRIPFLRVTTTAERAAIFGSEPSAADPSQSSVEQVYFSSSAIDGQLHAVQNAGNETAPSNGVADNDLYCSDEVFLDRYLGRADVRAALHVPPNFNGTSRVCYDIPYTSNVQSVVSVYETLIASNRTVVIYNGDMDLVVPYTGTLQWIAHSTNWAVAREMSSWNFIDPLVQPDYGPQAGGQAFQLISDARAASAVATNATIQLSEGVWVVLVSGAGHMVPQDRPAASFEVLQRILSRRFFPESPLREAAGGYSAFADMDVASLLPPAAPLSWLQQHAEVGGIGLGVGAGVGLLVGALGALCIIRRQKKHRWLLDHDNFDRTIFQEVGAH